MGSHARAIRSRCPSVVIKAVKARPRTLFGRHRSRCGAASIRHACHMPTVESAWIARFAANPPDFPRSRAIPFDSSVTVESPEGES
jgi:hypothetical protein